MEFVEGQTLADIISGRAESVGHADSPRTPAPDTAPVAALTTLPAGREFYRAAAALIADAADALEHAHSVGIVHRDVKPANLLVDEAGKVYVSAFGLARFGTDAGLTISGDLLGTLRYMAPEQALARHGLVDHRADVYALGATLYELMTLQPAVGGEDKQEVLRRIAFEDPVPPRKVDKAVPAELETVVLKCLAKEPGERYAIAGELAADLRRFLGVRPVRARPPTLARRASKWAARHRAALAAAAAVLLVATAIAVAGLLWHNDRLRDEAAKTAHERDAAREEQRWASRAVDDMYTQVAEQWLGPQPHLQPLQRTFLEEALGYYQHAAERWDDDPVVRRKVPELHERVAKINAALGQHGPAEEALHKAITGLEELAAESPDRPSGSISSPATATSDRPSRRPGGSWRRRRPTGGSSTWRRGWPRTSPTDRTSGVARRGPGVTWPGP
jgi:hypothetical protein